MTLTGNDIQISIINLIADDHTMRNMTVHELLFSQQLKKKNVHFIT